MKEYRLFKTKVHPLYKSEFLDIIETNLREGIQIVQNGVNASSIIELINNKELSQAYNNSNLINIDGMSVVWALRFLGYYVPERVACPDLAEDILRMAEKNNFGVFLLGTTEKSIRLCVKEIIETYPDLKLLGHHNGYFNNDEEHLVIKMINNANPDILFIGMPSPKKEFFVEKYRGHLSARYFLGVGGYFDIISGITRRAPNWIQSIGMEWFYRLLQEPKRMWRRYLIGNSRFIWLVIQEKYNLRQTTN